jgi:ribosome recycling factor
MYQQVIDKIRPHLDRTVEYLKNEFNHLQVGRATPALVENLEVECYGQKMPLKQLASIQTPEPSLIIIRPWDKAIIKDIERVIIQSKLKLVPVVEEDIIRLRIPPLTEERRKELVGIIREKLEECRVSIRRHREEAWQEIQTLEKNKEITEDDKFRGKSKLQEVIDEYNKKIEEMGKKKEEEILKV